MLIGLPRASEMTSLYWFKLPFPGGCIGVVFYCIGRWLFGVILAGPCPYCMARRYGSFNYE